VKAGLEALAANKVGHTPVATRNLIERKAACELQCCTPGDCDNR
jgi:hypothetical protein